MMLPLTREVGQGPNLGISSKASSIIILSTFYLSQFTFTDHTILSTLHLAL